MNIQSALGRGRTALRGGTWVGGELIGINGLSNEYGNRTTNYTYVGTSRDADADLSFMSYRGCENLFGNIWIMTDGVIFKGTTNSKTMWYSTNPTEYNETGTGYVNSVHMIGLLVHAEEEIQLSGKLENTKNYI